MTKFLTTHKYALGLALVGLAAFLIYRHLQGGKGGELALGGDPVSPYAANAPNKVAGGASIQLPALAAGAGVGAGEGGGGDPVSVGESIFRSEDEPESQFPTYEDNPLVDEEGYLPGMNPGTSMNDGFSGQFPIAPGSTFGPSLYVDYSSTWDPFALAGEPKNVTSPVGATRTLAGSAGGLSAGAIVPDAGYAQSVAVAAAIPLDTNNVPVSAGFGGFDASGNWVG